MGNHRLARAIGDVGFATFRRMVEYKCEWYGKNLVVIGRFEPSSRICNRCGYYNHELKLSERDWICPQCGANLERDFNASLNIRDFAFRSTVGTTESYVCGDMSPVGDSAQEATGLVRW